MSVSMSLDDVIAHCAADNDKPVRATCVQAASVIFDTPRTLQKARHLIADAAQGGAQLVLLPEAFVGGYPRGAGFGTVVGARLPEGRELYARYHAGAIDVPGPAVAALGLMAKENRIHLVVGVIEREGLTLYCSLLFFSPAGELIAKRRKLMPTGGERLIWGFGDGSTLTVLPTPLGKLCGVICWENYMPLLRAAMYAQGAQIWCAPTADGRPTWLPTMQHIAMEGRCFVMSTNQFCRRSDFPADYPSELPVEPDAIVARGGACIIDPMGVVLAGPLWDMEGSVSAELDLRKTVKGGFDFDPVGHYARADVFRLHVDTRPKPAVSFSARSGDEHA
jgi:nitrilase